MSAVVHCLRQPFLLICLITLSAACAASPERDQGNQDTDTGAVASAHPLASKAGREVLAEGGNAFDAAVAMGAAINVVEPFGSGIGGGGFWLMHDAGADDTVMVDGRETAPGEATADMFIDEDGEVDTELSREGPLAAAIPGQPAALVHIAENHATLPLERLLQPAIEYAREGFEVGPSYVRGVEATQDKLRAHGAAEVFMDDGEVPEEGWVLRQPELAETLERIAADGHAGFYDSELTDALVDYVRDAGGIWQREDFENYQIVERDPIVSEYRDATLTSAAPPSSGGVVLATTLNILEGWDLDELDEAERVHLISEALRRTYRDRGAYLGDPDFVDMPIERLVHPHYAAGLRAGIHPQKATPSDLLPPVATGRDAPSTTHFSVVDADGNRVGATLTINFWFGSGVLAGDTGVLLNNEMDDFASAPGDADGFGLVEGEANRIEPGKRMLSSMTPTFIEDERGVAVLGSPGGSRIITSVLTGILEYLDGGDARSMVERPRFHHQYRPDEISYEEDALSEEAIEALRDKGHRVEKRDRRWGNVQVVIDWLDDGLEAASDPRGEGEPDVY